MDKKEHAANEKEQKVTRRQDQSGNSLQYLREDDRQGDICDEVHVGRVRTGTGWPAMSGPAWAAAKGFGGQRAESSLQLTKQCTSMDACGRSAGNVFLFAGVEGGVGW